MCFPRIPQAHRATKNRQSRVGPSWISNLWAAVAFGDKHCGPQKVFLGPWLECPGLVWAWWKALGWHFLPGVLSSDQGSLSLCPSPWEGPSQHWGVLEAPNQAILCLWGPQSELRTNLPTPLCGGTSPQVCDGCGRLQSSVPALAAPLTAMLLRHLCVVLVLVLQRGRLRPREGQQPGRAGTTLRPWLEGAGWGRVAQSESGCPGAQRLLLSGPVLARAVERE